MKKKEWAREVRAVAAQRQTDEKKRILGREKKKTEKSEKERERERQRQRGGEGTGVDPEKQETTERVRSFEWARASGKRARAPAT